MTFQDIIPILKLDKAAMKRVANDNKAIQDAHIIVAVSAFTVSILSSLMQMLIGELLGSSLYAVETEYNIGMIAGGALVSVAFAIGFLWLFAAIYRGLSYLMGGKGSIKSLFNVIGHSQGLSILAWIPLLNLAIYLWLIIVNIFIVRELEEISTGKAIAVVLIPLAIVLFIIFMLFIALFGLIAVMAPDVGGNFL